MSLQSVLQTYGQIGVKLLRQAVAPLDATKKTFNSIRFGSDAKGLKFFAREYFSLLEKGRRPTSKNPSPEMIANLTEYAQARGMENPKSAAWAIAKKINKDGDKTFNSGGRVVYSDDMKTFTKELATELAKDFGKEIAQNFKKEFK